MFRDEFTKIIEFSLLEPEPLIKLFYPEFDLMAFVKGEKVMVTDKDQEASVLKDLKVYIGLAAGVVLLVLSLVIFRLVKMFRAKIEEKLDAFKKQFMWNGFIQSIDITYIEVCLTVGTQVTMQMQGSEWQDPTDLYVAIGLGIGCLLIPLIVVYWLHINHNNIMSRVYKNKYEYMYTGIHNHRSIWSKFYWPVSLFRKIIFVSAPTIFYNYPFAQLMMLIFLSTFYILFYAGIRPHWDNNRYHLEVYNEVMIMMFNYHMMLFSDYCFNQSFQYMMGTSYACFLGIVVLVNISNMVRNTIEKGKRLAKLDKLRAN